MPDPTDPRHEQPTEHLANSLRRRHPPRKSRRGPAVVIGLLLLGAAGIAWWWFSSKGPVQPSPVPEAARTVAPVPDTVAGPPPVELPKLAASDEFVRNMATKLSAHPEWAKWLVNDNLVRRFVTAVAAVSAGRVPRERFPFMAPQGAFRIRIGDGGTFEDSASYHRFDGVAETFASLDPQGSATLFHQLHPLFVTAYGELGMPGGGFDAAVSRALGLLLAVPVPNGPVELVHSGEIYNYKDPDLQKLKPVQRQLLRMGPDNERKIQAELRALADAIGIQPSS